MQLGHLLTRSGLTYPEVSSKVYHDSFCQSESNVSLPWVICFEALYLRVVSSFSCIPVICPKLVLFLTPLQLVHLFCNLSKCILLFFSSLRNSTHLTMWRKWIFGHWHKTWEFHSWVKRDQLDATCFIITLFNAQHVLDVNTSILRSLRLIRWVTSWVVSVRSIEVLC